MPDDDTSVPPETKKVETKPVTFQELITMSAGELIAHLGDENSRTAAINTAKKALGIAKLKYDFDKVNPSDPSAVAQAINNIQTLIEGEDEAEIVTGILAPKAAWGKAFVKDDKTFYVGSGATGSSRAGVIREVKTSVKAVDPIIVYAVGKKVQDLIQTVNNTSVMKVKAFSTDGAESFGNMSILYRNEFHEALEKMISKEAQEKGETPNLEAAKHLLNSLKKAENRYFEFETEVWRDGITTYRVELVDANWEPTGTQVNIFHNKNQQRINVASIVVSDMESFQFAENTHREVSQAARVNADLQEKSYADGMGKARVQIHLDEVEGEVQVTKFQKTVDALRLNLKRVQEANDEMMAKIYKDKLMAAASTGQLFSQNSPAPKQLTTSVEE
jgi:hypothetical protein